MNCVIIDHHSKSTHKIAELFSEYNPQIMDFTEIDKKLLNAADFVILSGGDIHISSPLDLVEEKQWIRETNTPILGICLGMEILAICYGSSLHDLPEKRRELRPITIGSFQALIFNSHECFIQDIQAPLKCLHRTENIVDVIINKTQPQLGLQGHPELSNEGPKIRDFFIQNFVKSRSFTTYEE